MVERDNRTFSVISQKPEFTSSKDSRRLILEAIEGLQKVERNYMGREEITVWVPSYRPQIRPPFTRFCVE